MRIPFKFNLGSTYRDILCILFNFQYDLKKSNLEGVFEIFYSDPQLNQNLKPRRNLCGQLLYIFMYICV